ncbi:polyphosphate kinase 1 [Longimicrobium terrae]|uniref:Polyphosphate kinase n=1 Tax=Longimicrobium terrae TaxID=1639882 RepID=A0A841H1Z6_9BACT|nr:polyphosphate kinase 1 [Longimicrobium terrae]MBB4637650.1 polyphosphate kinase 1 [Longimicrobium terrae]MBB6072047.1 polyphosphate kinase 1 [Longimicrobium terrae]NNC29869.1 polyphosphate kinase 1 [Longimicrobium terrae]
MSVPQPLSGPVTPALRYDSGIPETLRRISAEPPPEGLEAGTPRLSAWRDVYWDTEAGDLEGRGAWACVRHHEDGTRIFAVRTGRAHEGGSVVEAPLEPASEVEDEAALFIGATEPALRLRALVDPALLVPRIQVETQRQHRVFRTDTGDAAEVACDAMVARDGRLRAELSEVVIAPLDGNVERVAGALRHAHGLPRVDEDRLERARTALRERELDGLERAVRAARRVAVLAMENGRVALRREKAALRVPSGAGSGEDACRQVLRECFGDDGARVRLLGTGPGAGERAAVEVWLAEGVNDAPEAAACVLVHVPLGEILASVGSPALREHDTLVALHVAARSALPLGERGAAMEAEEAEARRTLTAPPPPEEGDAASLPPGTLLNMELSLLAFNRRVLGLAEDERVPLLERVRFLAIFGGNTDEFFRVRVAGFKRQVSLGSEKRTIDGVRPQDQLDAIGVRSRRLMERAYALLHETLLPEMARRGIQVAASSLLDREERSWVRDHFEQEVRPLLMPLTAGPEHPFPHVRNLRPALAGLIRDASTGEERLGIVELPDGSPRFVRVAPTGRYVPLEEVVAAHFGTLYPGMETDIPHAFRVTRSAELHLDERQAEDLLHAVEEQVRKRRFRPVVRLEVQRDMPARVRAQLLRELQYEAAGRVTALGEQDVYEVAGIIDLRAIRELATEEGEGLNYPPPPPARTPLDPSRSVFDLLREREVLVSFPEDSFEGTVERLVVEAAEDPDVLAIKLALYRTNSKSRIVEALTRAAAAGKQVVALVELTARFDELSNVQWARYLRSYGIHVIYGVPGLKVHAKIALVVRREGAGLNRYVYIGTGNLNASTAAFYTDLGLMSASPALAAELNDVFNVLTSAAPEAEFQHLLVAPFTMRRRFVEMIDREADHARAGRGGWIQAKFNGLADRDLISALYRASAAGVRIDLLVRGLCALRPGVAGLSENIRVFSVLGRYLEHARIFRFENGGDPAYYIGSGDWRTRNLSRRIEVAVPIRDPDHHARLDHILEEGLDRPELWELGADGTYYQRPEVAPRDVQPAPAPDGAPPRNDAPAPKPVSYDLSEDARAERDWPRVERAGE